VSVTSGGLYRVGVHNTEGRYVATVSFAAFASGGLTNGDLFASFDGSNPVGLGSLSQGTFQINAAPTYPTQSFSASCYFVDVQFLQVDGNPPPEATGAGAAFNATVDTTGGAAAGLASATGTAEWDSGASISLDLAADFPVDAVGTAYDATVSTSSAVNASAGEASAVGQAFTPAAAAGVPATEATAAGVAFNPSVSTLPQASPDAGLAAASGVAIDPVAAVQVLAAAAEAVAEALGPSVLIGGDGAVSAGVAEGSGQAFTARPSKRIIRPYAGVILRP